MRTWPSRWIGIVIVSFLLALASSAADRRKLAWLDSTPADQVVAHQRQVYSHGYAFQVFAILFAVIILVLAVELVAWCMRKVTTRRVNSADNFR
jgi:hypothetical protein